MHNFCLSRFQQAIVALISPALALLLLGAIFFPTASVAQGGATASLAGKVADSSGAVVPAAKVVVTQAATGLSRSVDSGPDGSFSFPVLPVGHYRLQVQKEGFNSYEQTGINLTVNQAAQIGVSLKPGRVEQKITVNASATPVDTTTGELSTLVDEKQVVDLPLNGRNPAELVFLSPGVANMLLNSTANNVPLQFSYPGSVGGAAESQGALAPIVNGFRPGGVYFSLDGANNVDPYAVTGGPFPNPDAVQEFRMLTSGYGAEYVSAPGGAVNIVTKSGTNDFHGTLFEFIRNGALNGRNYFAAKQDNVRRNQFGVAAGGPILKNKFFIFGSYQKTILRSSVGGDIQFVPTDAERAGDFSAVPNQLKNPFTQAIYPGNKIPLSDFSPITSQLLAWLPHSTAPDGRVEVVHPTAQDENQYTVKGDYVRGKQTFVARYFLSDFHDPGVDFRKNLLAPQAGTDQSRWQDIMLGHNYATTAMINEFRFTYQRSASLINAEITESFKQLGAKVTEPAIKFIQFFAAAGFFQVNGGSFNGFPRETFTVSDRVTLVRGKHQISFGTEISHLRATEHTDFFQGGGAVWAPLPPSAPFTSGSVLSDFVLGKPTVFIQGDGLLARARGGLWGFYGQDQMRVSPRLTLTAGIRWDPYWPFHTLHGRASCFVVGQQSTVFTNAPKGLLYPGDPNCDSTGAVKPDLGTIQPRIGFAFDPYGKGHTAFRGGYGIYSVQFPMQSFLPFAQEPPYIRSIQSPIPKSLADPWGNFPGGDPFASGFHANDQSLPSNTAFPASVTVNVFGPQYKLGSLQTWNLTLEQVFWKSTVLQVAYVGNKGTHLSFNREGNAAVFIPGNCAGAPCSTAQNTNSRRPIQGLGSVKLAESGANSNYNALQVSVQRRVSEGLTISMNYTWAKAIDTVSQGANGTLSGAFNSVTNPSNPQEFRAVSDFDLSHAMVTSAVWRLPRFEGSSFIPKHLLSRWQVAGIWTWQVGLPFSVYSGIDNSLTGVGLDYADLVPGVDPRLSPDRSRSQLTSQYFNLAAFQPNALGTFGNSGRNILRGPGYFNVDMSLGKTFPLWRDRYTITFRAEAFNVSNTPHFTAPGGGGSVGLNSPKAGQILHARDPRILQFGLKFNW